jgi:hypothetical protein
MQWTRWKQPMSSIASVCSRLLMSPGSPSNAGQAFGRRSKNQLFTILPFSSTPLIDRSINQLIDSFIHPLLPCSPPLFIHAVRLYPDEPTFIHTQGTNGPVVRALDQRARAMGSISQLVMSKLLGQAYHPTLLLATK